MRYIILSIMLVVNISAFSQKISFDDLIWIKNTSFQNSIDFLDRHNYIYHRSEVREEDKKSLICYKYDPFKEKDYEWIKYDVYVYIVKDNNSIDNCRSGIMIYNNKDGFDKFISAAKLKGFKIINSNINNGSIETTYSNGIDKIEVTISVDHDQLGGILMIYLMMIESVKPNTKI